MTLDRDKLGKKIFAVFIVPGIALVLLSFIAYLLSHQLLVVESGPVHGDVILVLGGGWIERSQRAAELYNDRAAPRLVVTGMGDCETNRRRLKAQGVPPEAIQIECQARNTRENALNAIPLLRQQKAQRVILVTTWYHSRRALACFRHYAPDIQFYSRPSYYAYARADWAQKSTSAYLRAEYVKIVAYWIAYGVSPL
jgi:uncharacterized SAM-binding protein YcdF (DUF218 family)